MPAAEHSQEGRMKYNEATEGAPALVEGSAAAAT